MDQDKSYQHTAPTSHDTIKLSSENEGTLIAEKFWALSPHILAGITVKSVEFFRLYYKVLATKLHHLQATIIDEFGKNEDCKKEICSEKFEGNILQYFRALLTVDDKVHEVTMALVKSQVEETAAKILAITPDTVSNSSTPPIKYPVNIWRKVLAMADEVGRRLK